jgi:hypothetical protein
LLCFTYQEAWCRVCRRGTLALSFDHDNGWIPRLTRILLTGVAAGTAAMALFMVIHSLLIFPVWTRVGSGLPLALIGGVGLAGAFDHLAPLPGWMSVRGGARFGALMFATLVPTTVFSNALRIANLYANDWPGVVVSLAIALATGGATGWFVIRRRDGAIAFAGASVAVIIAMAGPIPVVNGPRAAWLFVGFLPICVGAGIALALARARLVDEELS